MNPPRRGNGLCTRCGFDYGSARSPRDPCPICHDGQVDPWAIIREIREHLTGASLAGLRAGGTGRGPDLFETDWPILRASILANWPSLSAKDLAKTPERRRALEQILVHRFGYSNAVATELVQSLLDFHDRLYGQWALVREAVPRRWPDLPAGELERLDGTLTRLVEAVARSVGKPFSDARKDVVDFLVQLRLPALVQLSEPDLLSDTGPPDRPQERDDDSSRQAAG